MSADWSACSLSQFHLQTAAQVPCVTAEAIRRGYGSAREASKMEPNSNWKKNCSRNLWRGFDRQNVGWKVPLKTYDYITNSGDVIPMTYICPVDLMTALLENHLDLVVGGLQCQKDIAENLHAFWEGFQLSHRDHVVFEEHCNNLQSVIPLCWHGDEGRGKRRGNTCVISLEAPIGIQTAVNKKTKKGWSWTPVSVQPTS